MIRRLSAIATWVLLLHLNLVASDLVCAKRHDGRAAATAAVTSHHHAEASSVQMSDVSDGDAAPCKVPTRTTCCEAMASCAVNVGLVEATSDAALPLIGGRVAPVVAARPVSLTQAPEPPPPKA